MMLAIRKRLWVTPAPFLATPLNFVTSQIYYGLPVNKICLLTIKKYAYSSLHDVLLHSFLHALLQVSGGRLNFENLIWLTRDKYSAIKFVLNNICSIENNQ